jgi:predicted regulator of Ras-like GTPase activity (Roadblock/LC7/MglB family)
VDLNDIATLPEVKSVLLCDPAGALLGAVREGDAESAAAVTGFLATSLGQIGEELGLGPLYRMSVAGKDQAVLLLVLSDSVLSAIIQPASAFPAAEHAIDSILQG